MNSYDLVEMFKNINSIRDLLIEANSELNELSSRVVSVYEKENEKYEMETKAESNH